MRQFYQNLRRSFDIQRLLMIGSILALFGSPAGQVQVAPIGLAFSVGSTSAPPGAQIIIPVQVNGFSNVSTFQFSFHYDSNDAVLLDIGTFGLNSLVRGNFDTNQAINGILG